MQTSVDCAVQADFPVVTAYGATVQVRTWLPRLWLTELPTGGVDLAVVIDRRVPDAAMIAELQHLLGNVSWPQPVVESAWRLAPPTAEWPRALAQAVSRLGGIELAKVVLARCANLQPALTADASRWSWYCRLLHRRPDACVVDVNIPEQISFLCASPERLVRCRGSAVDALALAGTTAIRAAPVDEKLIREHACVRDWILRTLVAAGVDMVPPDQPTLRDAGSLVHLATPLHGRRPDGLGTLALALRLHPTPALLGLPRADALAVVAEMETQPRVWYGGFVGVLAADRTGDGEVVVVLRGVGRAGDAAWTAWAGAGLVPGSDPSAEAEEIERKLAAICDSLTDAAQVHRETCR
jgi:menaquinone-specific isochorismate synthase